MDPQVIDNFLPKELYDSLKESVNSEYQPWFFVPQISLVDDGDYRKHYGFSCNVVKYELPFKYERLPCTSLIYTLHQKIKDEFGFKKVIRCRLDMTTYRGEDEITFGPHIDMSGEDYTSIFYLTECNAPTIIYNEKSNDATIPNDLTILKRVEAKENRVVVFKGDQIHSGMCATDVSRRILINTNFYE